MLRLLMAATAVATVVLAVAAFTTSAAVYLPACAAVITAVLWFTRTQPKFWRFLNGLYALAFLVLAAITALNAIGTFPESWQGYLPPPNAAIIATILALVNYGVWHIPVVRRIIELAAPYYETEDREEVDLGWLGKYRMKEGLFGLILFGVIIVINVAQVYMNVIFSFWNNRFYTSLQEKNAENFWVEITFFCFVAFFWIVFAVYEAYLRSWLNIRWRRWMTLRYIGRWMNDGVHYRMKLVGDEADNPDQRIAEDIGSFVSRTQGIYIQMFSALLNLYAFVQILWNLSSQFPYTIGGIDLAVVPGYLVWIALFIAIIATFGTHLIGKPLVALNFRNEQVEADFRFNAARLREYSEQIALLDGETTEKQRLMTRFRGVIDNTLALMDRNKKLTWFTASYNQASVILPFLVLAPAYFTTPTMQLGALTQTAGAFGNVNNSFSFFVDFYATLAAYKAVLNRLWGFDTAINRAEGLRADGPKIEPRATAGVAASGLDVRLPDGRTLIQGAAVSFARGSRTLITGPSGSGKTSLFRALAGVWPFGRGVVEVPANERVMLLPQAPYLPLGTLRAALAYPAPEEAYQDDVVRTALETVGLPALGARLDDIDNWTNALSGGEKQRVAIVRALLQKPQWLFLDEATSALDEAAEAAIYTTIRTQLPDTTIVSIGHRTSLAALHDRRLAIVPAAAGATVTEAPLAAFGATS